MGVVCSFLFVGADISMAPRDLNKRDCGKLFVVDIYIYIFFFSHTHIYIYNHTHTHTHIYIYTRRFFFVYMYLTRVTCDAGTKNGRKMQHGISTYQQKNVSLELFFR